MFEDFAPHGLAIVVSFETPRRGEPVDDAQTPSAVACALEIAHGRRLDGSVAHREPDAIAITRHRKSDIAIGVTYRVRHELRSE